MKVTIKDVAIHAGVSFKTVSRVINHEGTVKPDTLEKVNTAIAELNYQPNTAARNLAGSKSFALGFIYDNPNAYYVIDMQRGILEECGRKGYELIIHPCESDQFDIITKIQDMVKRTQLSGLIVSPPLSENPTFIEELARLDIQFVRLVSGDNSQIENTSCVFIHDREAAHSIVEYLISLGHKKIAFISGEKDHKSTLERQEGYVQAMQLHGLEINKEWIVEGRYSFDSGVSGAEKLLGLENKPTAIFACNDEIAAGVFLSARLAGFDVPNQLSIVGFEDSPFSRQTIPQLTTAAQPTQQIGSSAAALLISNITQNRLRTQTNEPRHENFTPELVVRGSTSKCK
ncbi:LacI family DNA-binding transcriptional regulator [uncultured Paraglaciecola sp.]|uniref:LacI family DNA-binding transcriptional regulator n=1 Tax=uncultured Paraglaciecola sp. TaxID=1765024 RepID=UPI0025F63DD8|nr:LacI family DNA-binding transcriptional regulator [uncultured Paraglaciecola sp.]